MSESKTPRHDALRILVTERPLEFKQLEVWAALAEAENDLAAVTAERDALRADAERLDWIEAHCKIEGEDKNWYDMAVRGATIRKAIDASRAEEFRKSSEKPQNSETVGGVKFQIQKANYEQS